jgi:acetylornithine deacetylase
MESADKTVALLRDLVAFATVSETPNLALQSWLENRLVERGAVVQIVPGPLGRANLWARLGPDRPGGLLLAGHTDVVPPGDGWATDPWQATVIGDRVQGRGTADMKGFFAAALVAFEGLDAEAMHAPVHLVASYDEEIGCRGVRDVLPLLADDAAVRPDLVLIGEPTMMVPGHTHLGKQVLRVTFTGTEAHSSRAGRVPSALSQAAAVVRALDELQAVCPPPLGVGEPPPYSVNVGSLHGGTQPNVIAARAELVFEIRFAAGIVPEAVLGPVYDVIDRARTVLSAVGGGLMVEELTRYPALAPDRANPAYQAAERLIDAGPSVGVSYGTEGGLFAQALDVPVIIFGPGDIAVAHRPDEYVPLAQLFRCTRTLARLIDHFCLRDC